MTEGSLSIGSYSEALYSCGKIDIRLLREKLSYSGHVAKAQHSPKINPPRPTELPDALFSNAVASVFPFERPKTPPTRDRCHPQRAGLGHERGIRFWQPD